MQKRKLDADGQVGAEIKITPEMIEAGCVVLRSSIHEEIHHDFPKIVANVFSAMKDTEAVVSRKGEPTKTTGFQGR